MSSKIIDCKKEVNMNKENNEIDILGCIEFDLTESIKDLIYNIKSLKLEVEEIKKKLPK